MSSFLIMLTDQGWTMAFSPLLLNVFCAAVLVSEANVAWLWNLRMYACNLIVFWGDFAGIPSLAKLKL